MLPKEDKAYLLLNSFIEPKEDVLGEITNVETTYEGRAIFRYEVMFDDGDTKTTLNIEVNLSSNLIKTI